jgi:large subunit ribosomal protein L30
MATKKDTEIKKLKITLVKSTIGAIPKHKKTAISMGLRKLNKTIELPDNDATRGQIAQIQHLLKVEEVAPVVVAKEKKKPSKKAEKNEDVGVAALENSDVGVAALGDPLEEVTE